VEHERGDEHETQAPQRVRARNDRHEQLAQELAVHVDVVDALAVLVDEPDEHLQVADHVRDHEPDADDASDGHHVLLADGGGVQVDEERLALPRHLHRCAGHGSATQRLCHEMKISHGPGRSTSSVPVHSVTLPVGVRVMG
jgi:hypothetical protein